MCMCIHALTVYNFWRKNFLWPSYPFKISLVKISESNRLKVDNDKAEGLVVASRRRVSVSQDSHLRVGSHDISFKSHVKSLGVYIDATLSTGKRTDHISRSAYLEIRRIISVCHLLMRKATVQLMCSFVLSRLDYCNSLLLSLIHI